MQSDLEAVRQRTRPRQVALYEIFNAILYIFSVHISMRQLPHDFPKCQKV
ncbi:transposase [Lactiplantibacillus plantarum]|nr:transposase [Lactiplantibacillus plantarum]